MNGCEIPKTPICVDSWKVPKHLLHRKKFFLSHMHADHTAGLSPSWRHPIYCSEVSAKLLKAKFNIDSQYIRPLALNQDHVIPLNRNCDDTMTVSLIDANHCPGSVMYIFEGYFGRIIYTGDFRYTPDMFVSTPLADLCKNPADKRNSEDSESTFIGGVVTQPVDALYLDNTFCNPGSVFPSREVAKQQIIDIIEKHPDHNILLGMHTLGKEELLVDLALHFKTWIIVNAKRYESLKLLDLPDVFSTDPSDGFIRVIAQIQVSKTQMRRWNETASTIAILPTGIYTGLDFKPYVNQDDVFIVPYSDHSSYSELHKFVRRIRPRKIIPVVPANTRGVFGTSFSDRANMHCFDRYIDSTPPFTFDRPTWLCKTESRYATEQDIDNIIKAGGMKRKRPVLRKFKSFSTTRGVVYEDSPVKTLSKASSVPQMDRLRQDTEKELVSQGSDRGIKSSTISEGDEKVYVLKVVEDSPQNTEDFITVEIMMNEPSDKCRTEKDIQRARCCEGEEGYQSTTETATLEKASKKKGWGLMPFDGVGSKQNPKWKKIKLTEDGLHLIDENNLHPKNNPKIEMPKSSAIKQCSNAREGILNDSVKTEVNNSVNKRDAKVQEWLEKRQGVPKFKPVDPIVHLTGDDFDEDIVETEKEVETKQRSILHQESHKNANMNSNNKKSELTVDDSLASGEIVEQNDVRLHPKRNAKTEKPDSTAIKECGNANKKIVNSSDKNMVDASTNKNESTVIAWLKKHQNVPKSSKPDNSDVIIDLTSEDCEEGMVESETTMEANSNIWSGTQQHAYTTCAKDAVQPLVSGSSEKKAPSQSKILDGMKKLKSKLKKMTPSVDTLVWDRPQNFDMNQQIAWKTQKLKSLVELDGEGHLKCGKMCQNKSCEVECPKKVDNQCPIVNKKRKTMEDAMINTEELFHQQETVDSAMDRIAKKLVSVTPSFEQIVNEVYNECLDESEGEEKCLEELSTKTEKIEGGAMDCQPGNLNSCDDKRGSKIKCNKKTSRSDCTVDGNYSYQKIKQLPMSVTSKSRFPNPSLAPTIKLQRLSWPARLKKFSSVKVKLQTEIAYPNTSTIECTATSTNCTPGQYKNTVKAKKRSLKSQRPFDLPPVSDIDLVQDLIDEEAKLF